MLTTIGTAAVLMLILNFGVFLHCIYTSCTSDVETQGKCMIVAGITIWNSFPWMFFLGEGY